MTPSQKEIERAGHLRYDEYMARARNAQEAWETAVTDLQAIFTTVPWEQLRIDATRILKGSGQSHKIALDRLCFFIELRMTQ